MDAMTPEEVETAIANFTPMDALDYDLTWRLNHTEDWAGDLTDLALRCGSIHTLEIPRGQVRSICVRIPLDRIHPWMIRQVCGRLQGVAREFRRRNAAQFPMIQVNRVHLTEVMLVRYPLPRVGGELLIMYDMPPICDVSE